MDPTTIRRLASAVAVLTAAQAALGVRFPEQYRDADWIRATWFGNDWVTLVVGAPLLLAASTARRSRRGLLFLAGMLAFAFYNDAFYLFGAALNVFFPIYVVVFVLSAGALIAVVSAADAGDLAAAMSPSTPARPIGGYLAFVGLGLTSVWIGIWAAYIFVGRPTPVAPDAFALVAAVDLSLLVPGLVGGGALLWRKAPLGYLIAPIAGIQATLYLLVLSVNSTVFIWRGLSTVPGELPLWGTLMLATAAATIALLRAAAYDAGQRQASGGDARR